MSNYIGNIESDGSVCLVQSDSPQKSTNISGIYGVGIFNIKTKMGSNITIKYDGRSLSTSGKIKTTLNSYNNKGEGMVVVDGETFVFRQ